MISVTVKRKPKMGNCSLQTEATIFWMYARQIREPQADRQMIADRLRFWITCCVWPKIQRRLNDLLKENEIKNDSVEVRTA